MRNYINLFFLGLLFLTACKSHKVPDGVIPEDKMIHLLTDVHITDGSLYLVTQVPDSLYKHGIKRYVKLFKSYNTDTLQFKKSMQYYTSDLDLMNEMYEQIMKDMQAKLDSINKTTAKQKK